MFQRFLILTILLLTLMGCNYRENKVSAVDPEVGGEPTPSGTPQPTPSPAPPKEWFTALQKTVFNPKCVECHRPGHAEQDIDLTSYKSVMEADPPIVVKGKPKSSSIYLSLITEDADKRMPKKADPLSERDIQTIYNWIFKGAPETAQD